MAANITVTIKDVKHGFCVNATSTDLTTAQTAVAAVAGKSHYLKSITARCGSTFGKTPTVTVQDNTAVTPIIIAGSFVFPFVDRNREIIFDRPIEVAEGKSIDLLSDDTGQFLFILQGETK